MAPCTIWKNKNWFDESSNEIGMVNRKSLYHRDKDWKGTLSFTCGL